MGFRSLSFVECARAAPVDADQVKDGQRQRLFIRLWETDSPRGQLAKYKTEVALDLWIGRRETIEFRAQSRSLYSLSNRVSPMAQSWRFRCPETRPRPIDYQRHGPPRCVWSRAVHHSSVPDACSCRPLADTLPPKIVLMDCLAAGSIDVIRCSLYLERCTRFERLIETCN